MFKLGKLRSKAMGNGLMASCFITELEGVLRDGNEDTTEYLEYGKGNWWNSEKFLVQLEKAILVAKRKYGSWANIIWRFDWSSNHKKKAENALNAHKMNASHGVKQRLMRDTWWGPNRTFQSMVFTEGMYKGQAKGLRQILTERGVDVSNKLLPELREIMAGFDDFEHESRFGTLVHEMVRRHGMKCRFYPKFHCELSPIEPFWSAHKRYVRAMCQKHGAGIKSLRRVVPEGLDSVCLDSIKRFFGRCRRYEQAYRLDISAAETADVMNVTGHRFKAHASHRRVFHGTF
jgi:hypothetical protein